MIDQTLGILHLTSLEEDLTFLSPPKINKKFKCVTKRIQTCQNRVTGLTIQILHHFHGGHNSQSPFQPLKNTQLFFIHCTGHVLQQQHTMQYCHQMALGFIYTSPYYTSLITNQDIQLRYLKYLYPNQCFPQNPNANQLV